VAALLGFLGFLYIAGRDRGGVLQITPNTQGGFVIVDQRRF
jgi:hypothetical protein